MSGDRLERIERLNRLREAGALTHTEFEQEKARILREAHVPSGSETAPASRFRFIVIALVAVGGLLGFGLMKPLISDREAPPRALAEQRTSSGTSAPQPVLAKSINPPTLSLKSTNVVARQDPEPGIGTIIEDDMPTIAGWRSQGGGYWGETQRDECCYEQFVKGNQRLIALTEPIERGVAGGVKREKIIKTLKIDLAPGEEEASDCWRNGRSVPIAYIDEKKQRTRGVFIISGRITMDFWNSGSTEDCSIHVD